MFLTATSRTCFIHQTPLIHNFVFSFYKVQWCFQIVTRTAIYLSLCSDLPGTPQGNALTKIYNGTVRTRGMGSASDVESKGTKLLKPIPHLEKNDNGNNSSLEYFFLWHIFTKSINDPNEKQQQAQSQNPQMTPGKFITTHFFFHLGKKQVSTKAAQVTRSSQEYSFLCRWSCMFLKTKEQKPHKQCISKPQPKKILLRTVFGVFWKLCPNKWQKSLIPSATGSPCKPCWCSNSSGWQLLQLAAWCWNEVFGQVTTGTATKPSSDQHS